METNIGFLQELREDILTAAWRESIAIERRAPRRRRGPVGRSHRKLVAALASAAVLLAAGGIGWYVTNGGIRTTPEAVEQPASGHVQSPARAERNPSDHAFAPFAPAAGPPPAPLNDQGVKATTSNTTRQAPAGPSAGVNLPQDLTKVVKTANLSVVLAAGTFGVKFQAAQQVAHRYGGYVQSSTTEGKRAGSLLIRVPERRFDEARGALAALGTRVERETVSGQDVTSHYIDLRARLDIAQTRRNTLVRLMRKAHSAPDVVRLQNEIDQVQLEIEQLQGELRVLNNRTSYGTIHVALHEAGVVVTPPQAEVTNPSLGNAVAHGVAGFLGVLFAVVIGLGYLIPVAALVAVGWMIYRRVRRARAPA